MKSVGELLARGLKISTEEASFAVRGFPRTPATPRLEAAGRHFIDGYNCALKEPPSFTVAQLETLPVDYRGFYAEGAAMGAAVVSLFRPWSAMLPALLSALEERYCYLAYVGIGWAVARAPVASPLLLRGLDRLLLPLAFDGRGFHDGFFKARMIAGGWRACRGKRGSIYDQGVGRSLWFSCGADDEKIGRAIASLDSNRHDDLWAGVGLAAIYAGGVPLQVIERLHGLSGRSGLWFRQGAAFALVAHARGGYLSEDAVEGVERITGCACASLIGGVAEAEAEARKRAGTSIDCYQWWRKKVATWIGA